MRRPSILLADDDTGLLETLRETMEKLGEVVEMVTDGHSLVHAAKRLQPDIIFTDISMPRMNGIAATRVLQTSLPDSRVIILTGHQESAFVAGAFAAGACGYLLKEHAVSDELAQALEHVLAGERYIGRGVDGKGACGRRMAALECT